jgi:transcriptional regulator with XRE-family HTH domain
MMRVKITRTPLWEWVRGAAELWRCRVPIGETLAEARQRAGLTVAQVSEQTRIREAVIKAIEGGDYAACGGDFYARAGIRSIARAVGAEPGPLIAEYDALHRARGSLSAVSLEELLAASVPAPRRSRAGSQAAPGPDGPAYRPRGRWLSRVVVLGLVVVLGFGVYSRLAASRHGAAAVPPAGGAHALTRPPAGPGGPGPAPKLTHAAVTPAPARKTHAPGMPAPAPTAAHAAPAPAPAAAAAAQPVTPAGAGAAGPGGGSPAPAQRAAGGSRATSPAHSLVHHRPPSEPVLRPRSAHRRASSGHGHRRRHHHRRQAPAAQEAAGQYGR